MDGIIVYGKPNCPFCEKAKALLHGHHLHFEYYDVSDPKMLTEMKTLAPESKTVPQIFWDGVHIGGYTELVAEVKKNDTDLF
jgi:glutaredoxin